MTFKDDVKLDTSQVEDIRGRSIGRRGMAVGGVGGVGGIIILVVALFLGGGSGGSGLGSLLDQAVGAGTEAGPVSTALAARVPDRRRRQRAGRLPRGRVRRQHPGLLDCRVRASRARQYEPSKTRFFTGAVQTGCGGATSAVGPFYCPADKYVYIDLGFFDELKTKFGAQGGPFAQAYVIAHEYGHHVQDLLGLLETGPGQAGATGQSVRNELQADCFAGVWAANAVDTGYLVPLTEAEIADALNAAAAVGDDRIQSEFQGRVSPESWTHGSSAQRQKWFTVGYRSGDPASCDTSGGL